MVHLPPDQYHAEHFHSYDSRVGFGTLYCHLPSSISSGFGAYSFYCQEGGSLHHSCCHNLPLDQHTKVLRDQNCEAWFTRWGGELFYLHHRSNGTEVRKGSYTRSVWAMLARSQLCLLGQNYACSVTAMLSLSELCSLRHSHSYTHSVTAMLARSQLWSLGQSYARMVTAMLAQSELCSFGQSYPHSVRATLGRSKLCSLCHSFVRSVRAMLVWSELPSLSQKYIWSELCSLIMTHFQILGTIRITSNTTWT